MVRLSELSQKNGFTEKSRNSHHPCLPLTLESKQIPLTVHRERVTEQQRTVAGRVTRHIANHSSPVSHGPPPKSVGEPNMFPLKHKGNRLSHDLNLWPLKV